MDYAELINAGPLGVVVFLVVAFGYYLTRRDQEFQRYISDRDGQWRNYFDRISESDKQIIDGLKQTIESVKTELAALRSDFGQHTREEMERFDILLKNRNTQQRKQ